jgi:8-oxo-dGTP diphosphatase
MLNRIKPPVMGLWHGVGGKIERGESPKESIIREISEETGIQCDNVDFRGIVSWNDDAIDGGMYAFLVELSEQYDYLTPRRTDEGILEWKDISWVLNTNNNGIPAHVKHFLPSMLNESTCYQHKCTFDNGILIDYQTKPLNDSTLVLSFL